MQLTWIAIPKGVVQRDDSGTPRTMLRVSAMPIIAPNSLVRGAAPLPNWPQLMKDALSGLGVSVGGEQRIAAVDTRYLRPEVWEAAFANRMERPPSPSRGPRALKRIADRSSDTARAVLDATGAFVALHVHTRAVASPGSLERVRITDLFTAEHAPGARAKSAHGLPWAERLRQNYSGLAEIFLPPKPGFTELRNASGSSNAPQFMEDVVDAVASAFAPDKVSKSRTPSQPVFSGRGRSELRNAVESLEIKSFHAAARATPERLTWSQAAVRHMASTVAYVPHGNADADTAMAARAQEHMTSEPNTLAALQAETGLLGVLGLVFDVEVDVSAMRLDGQTVSVVGVWRRDPGFSADSLRTHMNARGYPKSNDPLLTEGGYLRMGARDSSDVADFMLTDFRFDEAMRDLQWAAQADRNNLPRYSPAASEIVAPNQGFQQIHSHELTVHWRSRPNRSARGDNADAGDLFLEDLVIGARPLIGELGANDAVRWFDIAAKRVHYKKFGTLHRTPADLQRDAAFAPLVGFDKRTEQTCSVSEAFMSWNGWGYGVALPGSAPSGRFEKTESPEALLPRFSFGTKVFFAAKTVLRDGSSLPDAADVDRDLGLRADSVAPELVLGAPSPGAPKPFTLSRWERLGAPTVMHEHEPPRQGWWPKESATRIVVASAESDDLPGRRESSRVVVPPQMSNMHSTWRHGVFDRVSPRHSAYSSHARDPKTGGFISAAAPGQGGAEQVWRLSAVNTPGAKPYHPDPLVTRFRLWAIRPQRPQALDGFLVRQPDTPESVAFELYGDGHRWPHSRALKLKVLAAAREGGRLFELSANTLEIRMPRGERLTLVIVPEGPERELAAGHAFGEQRLHDLLGDYPEVLNAYKAGVACERRLLDEPYLATPVAVGIEHAVNRPCLAPQLRDVTVERAKEETKSRIAAEVAYDAGSTSAIELYYAEERAETDIAKLVAQYRKFGRSTPPERSSTLVASFGSSEIAGSVDEDSESRVVRPPRLAHVNATYDWHDFKHHRVMFWARALRNPEVAAPGEQGTPALAQGNAVASSALASTNVVHVLATKRPPPAEVRYLIPSFRFHIERERGRLRKTRRAVLALHMNGEWLASGPGELLVVVLLRQLSQLRAQPQYDSIRKGLNEYSSYWGADPVKQGSGSTSRLPDFISAAQLGCANPIQHHLVIDAAIDGTPIGAIELDLVPFEPAVCVEAASWRAEIPLSNPSGVSRPFVRLAVARYQPWAPEDLRLSVISLVEYLQLQDDRELVITRDYADERLLHVTLYGITHEPGSLAAARLTCWMEERCSGQKDGPASYTSVASAAAWTHGVRDGRSCWTTSIRAPDPLSCGRYRVAVMELETYAQEAPPDAPGHLPVYFDIVPVRDLH